jgi:hypothetical protein
MAAASSSPRVIPIVFATPQVRIIYLLVMLPFLEVIGRYLWSRAWDIADRVFKLASWGLLIAALLAINKKHPIPEIGTASVILSVLWLAAMLVSVVNAGMAFQDKCAEHIAAFKSLWVRLPLSLVVALAVTYSVGVLLRGATVAFASITTLSIKADP